MGFLSDAINSSMGKGKTDGRHNKSSNAGLSEAGTGEVGTTDQEGKAVKAGESVSQGNCHQQKAGSNPQEENAGTTPGAKETDRSNGRVIWIDDRIGSKDLLEVFLQITNDNPKPVLTKQYSGDVVWEGNGPRGRALMAIERKRVGDLVSSLVSGRLVGHQIPAMYEAGYEFIWLLVEGSYRPHPVTGILQEWDDRGRGGYWRDIRLGRNGFYMWRDLENWLTTLKLFTGIQVEKTHSPFETAQYAVGLFRYFQKEWKDHKSHLNFHHSGPTTVVFNKPTLVARIAKEFDGIGWDKAMAVAAKFKTPDQMFEAERSKWLEIPGIGKTIVNRVFEEKSTGITREKKEKQWE